VEISNLFIKEGRIVSTKGRNHKDEIYDAKPELALPVAGQKFPVAVLLNKYSASASEILAAALQDHNRAVVIGERSYGKGSVQNIIMMEKDTSALKLTTASYWRPSGKNIHRLTDSKDTDDWGVKPTAGFEVPMKDEERLEYMIWRNDRDVVRANKKAQPDKPAEKEAEKPADKPKGPKAPFVDRVFQKALDYLQKEIARGPEQDLLERRDA
jgi:carboxyl-terminal processing protease